MLLFFIYVADRFFKVPDDNNHKEIFTLIGTQFLFFCIFVIWGMSYFIMIHATGQTYYDVARTIFIWWGIIGGIIASLGTFAVLIMVFFYAMASNAIETAKKVMH